MTFVGYEKVSRILGDEKARELVEQVQAETGLTSFDGPDDLYTFGHALVRRGGLLEAIGRSVKIQALLRGAQEPEAY